MEKAAEKRVRISDIEGNALLPPRHQPPGLSACSTHHCVHFGSMALIVDHSLPISDKFGSCLHDNYIVSLPRTYCESAAIIYLPFAWKI